MLPVVLGAVARVGALAGQAAVKTAQVGAKVAQSTAKGAAKGAQAAAKGARAAAKAGKKGMDVAKRGAKTAKNVASKANKVRKNVNQMRDQLNQARRSMQQADEMRNQLQQPQEEEEEEEARRRGGPPRRQGLMRAPISGVAGLGLSALGAGGIMRKGKSGRGAMPSPMGAGFSGMAGRALVKPGKAFSPLAAMRGAGKPLVKPPSPMGMGVMGGKQGPLAWRDRRTFMGDISMQVLGLGKSSIDLSTGGSSLLFTAAGWFSILVRATVQFIVGNLWGKGKHKYIAPLKYRGPWKALSVVDKTPYGPLAALLAGWTVVVIVMLIQFAFMAIMFLAMIAPLILAGVLFGKLFGSFF